MGRRAVVGVVVVVGVLVGGAAVADGVIRERTEERLATDLQTQIPGLDTPPEVTISGFPFLTQVLAGELQDVHVTAPTATVEGLRMEQIDVRLRGVTTGEPYSARDAGMTAFLPIRAVQDALGIPFDLAVSGEYLTTSATVLGLAVDVELVPRAAGRAIEIDVETFGLGGVRVGAQDLPRGLGDQLQGLSFPVEGLPQGIELTDLRVRGDGVELTAEGTDVVLDETALP
ncbi:DUF2993 domain-containing protein [Actinotalea sp. K2]|uniref:LmeA family phospholipid-binding protein n=1 Tax=Actinotalea sp. K2 TaxID=2939438 RepID=UPI002017EC2A|nr:DUF2993 domain-containing protein [Actinotalea sp. K2]MCL3860949.1 DUF2993 domain-containing protein [Actinotalea sp. K2]